MSSPTANSLTVSAGIPKTRTRVASSKEAMVKLTTNPAIIPLILLVLPSMPLAKIMGRIGSTHGEKTVRIPDTNAIGSKNNIIKFLLFVVIRCQSRHPASALLPDRLCPKQPKCADWSRHTFGSSLYHCHNQL